MGPPGSCPADALEAHVVPRLRGAALQRVPGGSPAVPERARCVACEHGLVLRRTRGVAALLRMRPLIETACGGIMVSFECVSGFARGRADGARLVCQSRASPRLRIPSIAATLDTSSTNTHSIACIKRCRGEGLARPCAWGRAGVMAQRLRQVERPGENAGCRFLAFPTIPEASALRLWAKIFLFPTVGAIGPPSRQLLLSASAHPISLPAVWRDMHACPVSAPCRIQCLGQPADL